MSGVLIFFNVRGRYIKHGNVSVDALLQTLTDATLRVYEQRRFLFRLRYFFFPLTFFGVFVVVAVGCIARGLSSTGPTGSSLQS